MHSLNFSNIELEDFLRIFVGYFRLKKCEKFHNFAIYWFSKRIFKAKKCMTEKNVLLRAAKG